MTTTIATLALSALALAAATTNASAAVTVTRDSERPTAATIVSAHCAVAAVNCSVYTVPAGKILHLTEVSFLVQGGTGQAARFKLDGFTTLRYAIGSDYYTLADRVDLYLPAGASVFFEVTGGTWVDISVWGALSDQ
jgi:hypothetical protein